MPPRAAVQRILQLVGQLQQAHLALKRGRPRHRQVRRRRADGLVGVQQGFVAEIQGRLGHCEPGLEIVADYDIPDDAWYFDANGAQVKTVIVDGRTVVENGAIPGLDVHAMRQRAQAYFETYKAAYSERDYLRRPPEVLFPPSFTTIEREAR